MRVGWAGVVRDAGGSGLCDYPPHISHLILHTFHTSSSTPFTPHPPHLSHLILHTFHTLAVIYSDAHHYALCTMHFVHAHAHALCAHVLCTMYYVLCTFPMTTSGAMYSYAHAHALSTCTMPHVLCTMDMHYGHALWTCTMDMYMHMHLPHDHFRGHVLLRAAERLAAFGCLRQTKISQARVACVGKIGGV